MDRRVGDGYPKELFIFTGDDHGLLACLECVYCLDICNDPKQCRKGHLFCTKCIEKVLAVQEKCPTCGDDLNKDILSDCLIAKNMINSLSLHCTALPLSGNDECQWIGRLSELNSHIRTCDYQSTKCTNTGCDTSVVRKQLVGHRLVCPFQLEYCTQCSDKFIRRESDTHAQTCTGRLVPCSNHGCKEVVRFRELPRHLQTCDYAVICCPLHSRGKDSCNRKCPKSLQRGGLEGHLTSVIEEASALIESANLEKKRLRGPESQLESGAGTGTGTAGSARSKRQSTHSLGPENKRDNTQVRVAKRLGSDHGEYYDGTLREGKKHGRGFWRAANGEEYEGGFHSDKYHGSGVCKYVSGDVYDGECKDGMRHGKGVYQYATGDVYEGEFKNNHGNGKGKYHFVSGVVYQGDFRNGHFHGRGKHSSPDGEVYEGDFRDDLRHGKGLLMLPGKSVRPVEYSNGELIS